MSTKWSKYMETCMFVCFSVTGSVSMYLVLTFPNGFSTLIFI